MFLFLLSRIYVLPRPPPGKKKKTKQVIPTLYVHGGDRYVFRPERSSWHRAFNVTPKEGIVYLQDPSALNELAGEQVQLQVVIYENSSHPKYNASRGPIYHDIIVAVHEANEVTACNNKGRLGCELICAMMFCFHCSRRPWRSSRK